MLAIGEITFMFMFVIAVVTVIGRNAKTITSAQRLGTTIVAGWNMLGAIFITFCASHVGDPNTVLIYAATAAISTAILCLLYWRTKPGIAKKEAGQVAGATEPTRSLSHEDHEDSLADVQMRQFNRKVAELEEANPGKTLVINPNEGLNSEVFMMLASADPYEVRAFLESLDPNVIPVIAGGAGNNNTGIHHMGCGRVTLSTDPTTSETESYIGTITHKFNPKMSVLSRPGGTKLYNINHFTH